MKSIAKNLRAVYSKGFRPTLNLSSLIIRHAEAQHGHTLDISMYDGQRSGSREHNRPLSGHVVTQPPESSFGSEQHPQGIRVGADSPTTPYEVMGWSQNNMVEPTEVNANRPARVPGGQISLDDSA
jgi:hypothetical protein